MGAKIDGCKNTHIHLSPNSLTANVCLPPLLSLHTHTHTHTHTFLFPLELSENKLQTSGPFIYLHFSVRKFDTDTILLFNI